jgi:hypothetical protein
LYRKYWIIIIISCSSYIQKEKQRIVKIEQLRKSIEHKKIIIMASISVGILMGIVYSVDDKKVLAQGVSKASSKSTASGIEDVVTKQVVPKITTSATQNHR